MMTFYVLKQMASVCLLDQTSAFFAPSVDVLVLEVIVLLMIINTAQE